MSCNLCLPQTHCELLGEAQWHKQAISYVTLTLSATQQTAVHNVETQGTTSSILNFGQFHICMQCIVNIFSPSLSYFCVFCSTKKSLFTMKQIYQRDDCSYGNHSCHTDSRASHSWVQETLLPLKQLGSHVCWMGLASPNTASGYSQPSSQQQPELAMESTVPQSHHRQPDRVHADLHRARSRPTRTTKHTSHNEESVRAGDLVLGSRGLTQNIEALGLIPSTTKQKKNQNQTMLWARAKQQHAQGHGFKAWYIHPHPDTLTQRHTCT